MTGLPIRSKIPKQIALERSRDYTIPQTLDLKKMPNGTNVYEIFDDVTERKAGSDPDT